MHLLPRNEVTGLGIKGTQALPDSQTPRLTDGLLVVETGDESVTVISRADRLEYKLLVYLLRRRGRTATREQILRDVWDLPSEVETRTIDRHVNALRDVMSGTGEDEWAIQSVYGIGYKLEGATRIEEEARKAT